MAAISSSRLSSCGSTLSPPPNAGSNSIYPPQDSTTTRKTHRTDTWTKVTSELVDDGFPWRKYGHRMTLNAKYPREYLRCTHKYDQGCIATKQVQRIQQHPPIYRTTYSARHTCKSDSNTTTDSSILLSFNSGLFKDHESRRERESWVSEPNIITDSSFLLSFNNDLNSCQLRGATEYSAAYTSKDGSPIGSGSYIATANSKNYCGDIQGVPYSYYKEGEEDGEEESVMGPAYKSAMSPESDSGKDSRLSRPSLSSHLPAVTVTSSSSTSLTSSPSSPSLRFDDVFRFRP